MTIVQKKILAPAKINLALDVLAKRPDGYHEVDMIMQSITWADELTFMPHPKLELSCNDSRLPVDERNLVWRAAVLLAQVAGIQPEVKIHIEKKIPMAAGLAGGSADAAAVLTTLNDLWKLGMSQEELMKIGGKLGADIPFCIHRGTMQAQGIGEKLTAIHNRLNCKVLLVTPNVEVSTVGVYGRLHASELSTHPNIGRAVIALENGDLSGLRLAWGNVLEEAVLPYFPEVHQLKELLNQCGAQYVLMSGSGPSVFALDPSEETVERFMERKPSSWFSCITSFLHNAETL